MNKAIFVDLNNTLYYGCKLRKGAKKFVTCLKEMCDELFLLSREDISLINEVLSDNEIDKLFTDKISLHSSNKSFRPISRKIKSFVLIDDATIGGNSFSVKFHYLEKLSHEHFLSMKQYEADAIAYRLHQKYYIKVSPFDYKPNSDTNLIEYLPEIEQKLNSQ